MADRNDMSELEVFQVQHSPEPPEDPGGGQLPNDDGDDEEEPRPHARTPLASTSSSEDSGAPKWKPADHVPGLSEKSWLRKLSSRKSKGSRLKGGASHNVLNSTGVRRKAAVEQDGTPHSADSEEPPTLPPKQRAKERVGADKEMDLEEAWTGSGTKPPLPPKTRLKRIWQSLRGQRSNKPFSEEPDQAAPHAQDVDECDRASNQLLPEKIELRTVSGPHHVTFADDKTAGLSSSDEENALDKANRLPTSHSRMAQEKLNMELKELAPDAKEQVQVRPATTTSAISAKKNILPGLRRISTTPLRSDFPGLPPPSSTPTLDAGASAPETKSHKKDSLSSSEEDDQHEIERRIRANDPVFNAQFNYSNNYIKTSKYTLLTFLPLNLFEQFQRLANFYFLCLLVLQLIPVISSLTPVTTAVPLIGVLALTAAKDAYDDFQRHRSDSQVNNRRSLVLRNGKLVEERWSKVQVGDVIRMENDQFIAADLLLLSTSEPNGLCYIETAELDGETNLKCRQCLPETAELGQDDAQIGALNVEIVCEPPNNHLNKFEGTLTQDGKKFALDNDKILLRGCILRNTQWCFGLVIFAGRDTKLMQNSGKTKFKRTSIDRLLNYIILGIVFFLLSMCLFCTIACGVWETVTGQYFRLYLPWDALVPHDPAAGATVIALLIFFSYAIVLNTVVPISLYVSVEVIRLAQSFIINWDQEMYYAKTGTPAKARTTTLNEELGQIEYIFSDKTGTLTQNIMTFNKCSIGGNSYGDIYDEKTGEVLEVNEHTPTVDLSDNMYYEPSFRWFDPTLLDAIKKRDANIEAIFKLLALCHTVMPEEKNGKLEYQAQSPDEGALVSAARNFGFAFKARTPDSITIEVMGTTEVYELLCILDFNNFRKRMSVILRRNGKIRLYCKGADSIVYEHLGAGDEEHKSRTQEHLNKFAGEGLRTLCLAARDLDEDYYEDWKARHHEASVSLDNREGKLDAIYEEIEQDLILLGATAIEDKLQDGVPQCIANLALAGIKIWVLTGDKQETAINIGYSCQLLTDEMTDIFIVDGHTADDVELQMLKCREALRGNFRPSTTTVSVITISDAGYGSSLSPTEEPEVGEEEANMGYALVINGHSLVHALHPKMEKLFLEVGSQCKSVICCRVTPLQKAMVVDLVKKYKKAVTLAIGDGANDVSMIKMAHIGVGISGQEGLQAVLASDYSIAQFRYLERLLLVHGRWSYLRMTKFLRYFFYKNFAFTLCHFWFAFFCGFSAQTVFDPMFISVYNLFYTSLPVLSLGIFDQDVNDANSLKYVKLYTPGHMNLWFNKKEFFKSVSFGCFTSAVLFFVSYGAYFDAVSPQGHTTSDHMLIGSVVATVLVIVVTVQIALDTSYWTVFNHITIWGSLVWYFALQYFYNYVVGGSYLGSLTKAMSEATFWFTLALTIVILVVPVLAVRFYYVDVHPTLSDRVRLKQRLSVIRAHKSQDFLRTPSARRSRRSLRSGYAFAHQEGFGRLITSGKIMRSKTRTNDVTALSYTPNSTASLSPAYSGNGYNRGVKLTPINEQESRSSRYNADRQSLQVPANKDEDLLPHTVLT